MTTLSPLPDVMLRPLIEAALLEDLGRAGDITTDALIPADVVWEAKLNARQAGVAAGMDLARLAFTVFDPGMSFVAHKADGDRLAPGDCLATIKGRARSLLSCERVALNFLGHLSGIASETNKLFESVAPHMAHIACTRKTTPGLRAVEKFAVRAGGGFNHRFGLDDAVLIKDNHIAVAGGVRQAIERARASIGHLVKVELEVDSLEQLDEAIALYDRAPIDAVLLDNMTPDQLRQAVAKVGGRFLTEASGRVTVATVAATAATGVDVISAGWITHSAPVLDIGLDIE